MKFKVLFYALCVLAIMLLQTTLLDYIKIFNVKPNLMFVFIVSVALLRGNVEGAITGFFTGLLYDITSGKILGFYALLGLYLGLIIGSVNKRWYRENIFVVFFFTFASTIIYEGTVYVLGILIKGQWAFVQSFKGIILPEAIYNSVVSIFIYILVIKINDWVENANRVKRRY